MGDDKKEKRTFLSDFKLNILDKIGKENIVKGDLSRYKIPEKLPEEPIKVKPKKTKPKKIEDINEFEAAFNYAMQKAYERGRLRTKYTGEGLAKLMLSFKYPGSMAEVYATEIKDPEFKKRKYIKKRLWEN